MTWITATNASDDAITELARGAEYLAEVHGRMPAAKVLREVLGVHRAAHALLRGGRQRMTQTRELLRIDSALLAHACLLLGDLGEYEEARAYGSAALLCTQEAGTDEGLAWTAMAKTARWQDRFAEAAGLAARGFDASGQAPVRAELAYREADAIALFGDAPRARDALHKAGRASEDLDDGTSAWSFSRGRQAIFTLSVCVHTGGPDGALRAAREADDYWDAGGGKVTATWAQVRAGAAMAHLLKNSLDGAAGQLGAVLELPPDQRIRTVTGYLDETSAMVPGTAFRRQPARRAARRADQGVHRGRRNGDHNPVSPLPVRFTGRWDNSFRQSYDDAVCRHLMLGGDAAVQAAAAVARQRLAGFTGLHMTPEWLHVTVLRVGTADLVTQDDMSRMLARAQAYLARTAPVTVTLQRVFYHPEAITLSVSPRSALSPVLIAARTATREVSRYGRPRRRRGRAGPAPDALLQRNRAARRARDRRVRQDAPSVRGDNHGDEPCRSGRS